MPKRRPWLAVMLACALVLAGCASSESGSEATGGDDAVRAQSTLGDVRQASGDISTTTGPHVEPTGKLVYGWHTALTPAWLDPQENPQLITIYGIQYALHDAMVKNMPGHTLAPSLAQSYKVADDYKSATFTIREGVKFHNGEPVTSEDVKFTYENYRGAQAKLLKDKLDRIETPDARTVNFFFKEPFLDFMVLYGTPASGAGWIVPKKYYQEVGPDGFKAKPIGAGPFKLVRNNSNTELELEAVTDYWRRSPGVKTLVYKFIADDATRFAALQANEIDLLNLLPGALIPTAKGDSRLTTATAVTAPFWLEFPGFEKPDNPFNDVRVRKAVSLALDRKAISDAEAGGAAPITDGNWVPPQWPGALQPNEIDPIYSKTDVAQAKALLAEAGHPNGFEVSQLTPLPPYFPLGERVIGQLAEIGIRTKLNKMERAAFVEALGKGTDALPGIVLNVSGSPGDAAARVRTFATCKGSQTRACLPAVEALFAQYEAAINPEDRSRLIKEVQKLLLDQWVFPYVWTQALINVSGPKVGSKPGDIWQSIPQYPYAGPFEDIQLKS